jgi:hypothetical protein
MLVRQHESVVEELSVQLQRTSKTGWPIGASSCLFNMTTGSRS